MISQLFSVLNFDFFFWLGGRIQLLEHILGSFVWRLGVCTLEIEGPFSYLDTEKHGLAIMKTCLCCRVILYIIIYPLITLLFKHRFLLLSRAPIRHRVSYEPSEFEAG